MFSHIHSEQTCAVRALVPSMPVSDMVDMAMTVLMPKEAAMALKAVPTYGGRVQSRGFGLWRGGGEGAHLFVRGRVEFRAGAVGVGEVCLSGQDVGVARQWRLLGRRRFRSQVSLLQNTHAWGPDHPPAL